MSDILFKNLAFGEVFCSFFIGECNFKSSWVANIYCESVHSVCGQVSTCTETDLAWVTDSHAEDSLDSLGFFSGQKDVRFNYCLKMVNTTCILPIYFISFRVFQD